MSNPPVAIVPPLRDGATPLDPPRSPTDASFDASSASTTPESDARSFAAPSVDRDDRTLIQPVSNVSEMAVDAGTMDVLDRDAGDGAPPSQPVPLAQTVEASTPPARAAVAAPAPTPAVPPVRCGWRTCAEGEYCCNAQCSACARPGQSCPRFCGAPTLPVSAPCGPNTCNVTEVCCNASCGTCVPSGGTCSKEPCSTMYLPVSPTCGMNTCNAGQVCCNPSCGICTSPGETCSLEPCS
jgi:hypothetical protein